MDVFLVQLQECYEFPSYGGKIGEVKQRVEYLAETVGTVAMGDYWKFEQRFSKGMDQNTVLLAFFLGETEEMSMTAFYYDFR
jgi:hypothetical protein